MTVGAQHGGGGVVQRSSGGGPSGLADVVELILDKGLVIDVFVRVALVGIEILTIDARIVVASVDTYLRFAEATNRLDLQAGGPVGLPDLVEKVTEGGMRKKGAAEVESWKVPEMLEAAAGKVGEFFDRRARGDDEEYEEAPRRRPQRRPRDRE
ncbi:gas vesicle protein GvpJ [Pseudonocardia bannensis]|uniref:Gas vesicle protein A n=1 Tax=Pseudonocardia bannensis TaxID=630973 RepID=A0A848DHN2_9PSEU|nr:gas vesicle protein GvpJ [Pseudonocardia bannensis]NMH92053.1 gas vesicle structural protein GvpA [Pseudonocardia bannensis]